MTIDPNSPAGIAKQLRRVEYQLTHHPSRFNGMTMSDAGEVAELHCQRRALEARLHPKPGSGQPGMR